MDRVLAFAPSHLESRLRMAWADLTRLARDRGLEHAFEAELHAVGATVEAALGSHRHLDVDHAYHEALALRQRLKSTPGKRGADTLRQGPAMGRSGRKRR